MPPHPRSDRRSRAHHAFEATRWSTVQSLTVTPMIGPSNRPASSKPIQCPKRHLVSQVAGDAEDHQGVGRLCRRLANHRRRQIRRFTPRCPGNWRRSGTRRSRINFAVSTIANFRPFRVQRTSNAVELAGSRPRAGACDEPIARAAGRGETQQFRRVPGYRLPAIRRPRR